jgi:hypothetical protein
VAVGNLLSHAGNGYAREPEMTLLEEVGHGYSHAGLVYEQLYCWFSYAVFARVVLVLCDRISEPG